MSLPELIKQREPREKGIMMSTPMVSAMLGCAEFSKDMTRRGYNPKRPDAWALGDVLYVKEAYTLVWAHNYKNDESGMMSVEGMPIFRADAPDDFDVKWEPSMFMPKKYARMWVHITELKVENLFDISEADARREGFGDRMVFLDYYLKLHKKEYGGGFVAMKKDNPLVWAIGFERIEAPKTKGMI